MKSHIGKSSTNIVWAYAPTTISLKSKDKRPKMHLTKHDYSSQINPHGPGLLSCPLLPSG